MFSFIAVVKFVERERERERGREKKNLFRWGMLDSPSSLLLGDMTAICPILYPIDIVLERDSNLR